ncbi:nucleoside-triphosphate diphosphatase, partial [Streptococcus sp.]|uniref:nucleoside-triphosphate diphosphatase n=1 Tax=Streptococcus sp. TaxID=1306 RepID=UPI00359F7A36
WAGFNYFTCFGDDQVFEAVQKDFHHLLDQLQESGLQIHVVSYQSRFRLLSFLIQIIKDKTQRPLELRQQAGATLVVEGDKLVAVYLPEKGLPLTDFFGQTVETASDLGDSILIATKNEGKTKEFRQFFAQLGYKVENLNAYPDLPDVAETGLTFEENARLKAETIAELTGKMVLADDSGLKVDVLGGMPGVWSARFSGPDATDASNNAKLLHELAMVFELKDRSAQFHCTLVMAAPGAQSLVVEADWEGYIATAPQGENGFGYDPLFLVGDSGKTSAELSLEEKNKISHRAKALEKLVEAFPSWQEELAKQS